MSNQTLVDNGVSLMDQLTADIPARANDTAVAHHLHHTPYLDAYFMAQPQTAVAQAHQNQVKLVELIARHFNLNELAELSFNLGIPDGQIAGDTVRDRSRNLVTYMARRNRLDELVQAAAVARPHVTWQTSPQKTGGVAIVSKPHIAVVVEIARPILLDVARYLDEVEADMNFLFLKKDEFLSPDEKWDDIISAFSQTMNRIKSTVAGAQLHFFLSAPVALMFGFGCIWGTVDEAIVYHYEKGSYFPVVAVSRALRG